MSVYGYRDNKLNIKGLDVNVVTLKKTDAAKSVTYVEIPALTVGTVAPQTAYLYLGSAGALMVSSTKPVASTVSFTNAGAVIATVV